MASSTDDLVAGLVSAVVGICILTYRKRILENIRTIPEGNKPPNYSKNRSALMFLFTLSAGALLIAALLFYRGLTATK